MLAITLVAVAAWAEPDEDMPEEEEEIDVAPGAPPKPSSGGWDFEKPSTDKLEVDEDDEGMHDFVAEQRAKPPPPDHWHVNLAGKAPFRDDFEIQVQAWDDRYVVVELPVLVAQGREAFVAEHPNGVVLVGEITSGGQRVVQQQVITAEQVLPSGPTLVFLQAALPNPAPAGDVRFLVKTGELPAPPQDRYARTTRFARK